MLNAWTSVTGGFNGRTAPEFSLFGFTFGNRDPELFVMGVPFREAERLWYLGLVLALAAYLFARNILRSRPGRALQTLRDSEVAAAVMGVNVQGYKARIFLVSSMYAGLAGVMYALSIGSIAPESFGLEISILYLAMIVLGGLGSVNGAVLGAIFVSALPLVFQRYADIIPFVACRAGWPPVRRPASSSAWRSSSSSSSSPPVSPGSSTASPGAVGPRPGGSVTAPPPPHRHPHNPLRPIVQHKGAPHEARQGFAQRRRRRCRRRRHGDRLQHQGTGEQRRRWRRRRGRRRPDRHRRRGQARSRWVSSPTSPVSSRRSATTSPTPTSCSGRTNQVCDTYDVELNIQDTGYVPQQGVQLYSGMKDSVLAMQQTIGSPINTALAPEYEADEIVNFPSAWSKTLTEIPGTGVLGATYDVEIANGYSLPLRGGAPQGGRQGRAHLLRG